MVASLYDCPVNKGRQEEVYKNVTKFPHDPPPHVHRPLTSPQAVMTRGGTPAIFECRKVFTPDDGGGVGTPR